MDVFGSLLGASAREKILNAIDIFMKNHKVLKEQINALYEKQNAIEENINFIKVELQQIINKLNKGVENDKGLERTKEVSGTGGKTVTKAVTTSSEVKKSGKGIRTEAGKTRQARVTLKE